MHEPLWCLGAAELARRIASREIRSQEVVASHLARIEEVNPAVNAITATLADEALAAARAADDVIEAGAPLGPLHGVPITVKENLDLAGTATTCGVVALRDNMARTDTQAVARMRSAGAVPIARTNLPDFALRAHTDNDLYGATVNPWNTTLTPGGSSGGDAVALATGMASLGLGNDVAGSVRMPAQCNGVCGLKPSRGRVPWWNATDPGPPLFVQLMAACGPIARHVEDLATALAVLSGPDPRDPWSVPVPATDPAHPDPGRTTVAVVAEPAGGVTHPVVAAAVRTAAAALSDAGYRVEEVEPPPVADAFEIWSRLVWTQLDTAWPIMRTLVSPGERKFVEHCLAAWPPLDRHQSADAWVGRLKSAQAWTEFQVHHPLVLGPTFTTVPFGVGFDICGVEETTETMRGHRLLTVANLVGLPSVAVPTGVVEGVPQGVQLIGPYMGDEWCLAAAAAIEERLGIVTPIDPMVG